MATFRKFTHRLFIISNIAAVFFFLLACVNSFLHPGRLWIIPLIGLAFPVLLLIVFLFFLVALFFRSCRRWALVSLAALLLGLPNIRSCLALHPGAGFSAAKPPHSLRVLTWNVRSFDDFITKKKGASGHRPKMMEFISSQDPDLICLQEFYNWKYKPEILAAIPEIRDRLHYPYYFFSHDHLRYDSTYQAGVIIFSKYPIVDSLLMRYARPDKYYGGESLIAADIHIGDDTIRIFTTHLQSVLFQPGDFENIENITSGEGADLEASRSIVRKLRYAFHQRADQAEAVRDQLDKSPHPGLLCGDFNDIPNSYTYFKIRGDWQDAFLKRGFGLGRTYVHLSPTLRIDYILADPRFTVLQYKKFPVPYSDHNPVVADLQLP